MQFWPNQSRVKQVMKTRLLQMWRATLLAAAILVAGGCVQNASSDTAKLAATPTNTPVATNSVVEQDRPVVELSENAPATERVEPAPGSDAKPVPTDLKLSPAASEIVKLAQAGVSETVMLAFITNSPRTFSLGSEQIVYFNDLGVSGDVLTAMIEHDRLLREGGGALPANPSASAAPAAEAQATQPDAAAIAAAAAPQAAAPMPAASAEAPPAPATTEAVPAPPTNITYNYFYDSLSPYGTWIEVDGYGRCWQPSVVVLQPGWRPYSHGGRWIYTDYGWYWHSDYSWGWAPFHYGRWFRHARWGWCWRPDTIWGPSWVSWRYTDAYCGWAPLPPAAVYSPGFGFTYYGSSVGLSFGFGLGWDCFSYVSWSHFRHHRPYHYYAPPHHARDIHRNAVVVNNIIVGNNNTIINRGIAPDRVSHFTKTELRPVRVREEAAAVNHPRMAPGDRLERGGRELVIRRPQIPQIAAPPVTVKSGRTEPRATSTAAFSDRRAAIEARSDRSSPRSAAPNVPVGGASDKRGTFANGVARGESRDAVTPKEISPRTRDSSPARLTAESPRPTSPPVVAARPPTPSAPASVESPVKRQESSSPSPVTPTSRREPAATTPANSAGRTTARSVETPARPNTTTTWTRPTPRQPTVAANSAPSAPAATQPSRPSSAPKVQTPTAPATQRPATPAPRTTYSAPTPVVRTPAPSVTQPSPSPTPRTFSAPAPTPSVRSEQRWSAPAPAAPPAVARPSSPPAYSPPATRPAPAPTPAPAPSFAPRPVPAAPPAAPSATPSPRSTPSPAGPPSSGGGRAPGGRSQQQQ